MDIKHESTIHYSPASNMHITQKPQLFFMLLFQCLLFLLIISAVPIRAFPQIIHDIHVWVHGAFAFKWACTGPCRTKSFRSPLFWTYGNTKQICIMFNIIVNIYHVCRIEIIQMGVKIAFRPFWVKHTRITSKTEIMVASQGELSIILQSGSYCLEKSTHLWDFLEQPSIPGRDLEWLLCRIWVNLSDEQFSYNWQHVDFLMNPFN